MKSRNGLITAFEPFAGRPENHSRLVLNLMSGGPWSTLVLPVEFERAPQMLADAVAHLQPAWVVSLGEADREIRIETCARNRDDSPKLADNAGAAPTRRVIVPGAPEVLPFRVDVPAWAAQLPESDRARFQISDDAGAFVCNHLAFHAEAALRSPGVPYLCIHVPKHDQSPVPDPAETSATIEWMMRGTMLHFRRGSAQ